MLYTVCCILYTVYCILYTVCCMLYAVYCILYTAYFIHVRSAWSGGSMSVPDTFPLYPVKYKI